MPEIRISPAVGAGTALATGDDGALANSVHGTLTGPDRGVPATLGGGKPVTGPEWVPSET